VEERNANGPYKNVPELVRRTRIGNAMLATLADADALSSISGDRRAAVWLSLGQETRPGDQPLLDGVSDDDTVPEELQPMSLLEEVYADYHMTGLSLKGHPMMFARRELDKMNCVRASDLPTLRDGRHVRVAGLVLMRQRPSTAKGITFVTIEDETGSMNLVLFTAVWERFFKIARASNTWLVDGKLENRKGVIHVIVGRLTDLSDEVDGLNVRSRDFR
jgi:error-prone DNA polymerase